MFLTVLFLFFKSKFKKAAIALTETLGNEHVFIYTWKTYDDNKAVTLQFDPSAPSTNSYMIVYVRRDVQQLYDCVRTT